MENEWEKVIICADSRSALERISNINLSYKLEHHTIYCKRILAQLQSQGRTIEFIWISSHTNIDFSSQGCKFGNNKPIEV